MLDKATKELVARGEGIDCYRVGPWQFIAEDGKTGESYQARSMYAAIRKALQARERRDGCPFRNFTMYRGRN